MNMPKKGERVYRDFIFDRAAINQESRTVELAFSSEEPYERWFGTEILDHSKKAIRLDRLKTGGPLLLGHNPDRHIGVIESVTIGVDKVGRSRVRFGKGALAEEIFQDVLDGIRSKVSVGYMVHEFELDSEKDGQRTFRATDWEPLEISIVSIPADNTVGVGREFENSQSAKEINMKTKEQLAAEAAAADAAKRSAQDGAAVATAPPVDTRALANSVLEQERARVSDLTAIGAQFKQFGAEELSREAITKGYDQDWLRSQILERAGKPVSSKVGEIGMSEKEAQSFSFRKAALYLTNPNDPKFRELAAFEIEASNAAATKAGRASQGLMIPQDVLTAKPNRAGRRDMVADTFGSGGALVDDTLLMGSFIELLRNKLVLNALGITVLDGLVGDVSIPRQTSGVTAYWVGEGQALTESTPGFGQLRMSPKTVGGYTEVTRKLLIQTSVDVEAMIRNELATSIALEIDRVGLYGIGSESQPLGLKNTTGVQTKDFAAAAPTWAEIVDMETKVAAQNADFGNLAYAINATMRGTLKTTNKVAGQDIFLVEDGEINGYRHEVSNQIAAGDIWFGNWANLIMGRWSGLDLMVNPYSGDTQGIVRITAFSDVDFACRRPNSFVRGNDTL